MALLGTNSSQTVTEYEVRVSKTSTKRYNIMAFNTADRVDFSTWNQAHMERDLSNKKIYQEEEVPESGAGSKYNQQEFRAEDQPWLLQVNGKAGRKFKGVKRGSVMDNASYYIFTQCPDGTFEAFPVQNWYNFTPVAKHRMLTAEETEEEWERRNKVLNHFSIRLQRRLRNQDEEEEETDETEKKAKRKRLGDLKIHDLEDDLELSSEESKDSEAEGEKPPHPKPLRAKKRKKAKASDDEAFEDSDLEGQEVDYMSDTSSSSGQEETSKASLAKEDEAPKGIDEASESSEESEQEKTPEEEEEEDSSDEAQTSEESDIDSKTSSALLMAKRKTPPKRQRHCTASSSLGEIRPGTPMEQGRRQTPEPPAAKHFKLEPQLPSSKTTPSSREVHLTEETVRRYLMRKPMTAKDLLKKFPTKCTGLSSDTSVKTLTQLLRHLSPERKIIGDKLHFFLKE